MTEARYTKRWKDRLEAQGAFVFKIRPGNGQRVGMPDIHVTHPDWTGWLELKWDRYPTSPIQKSVFSMLRSRGAPLLIVRGNLHHIEDPAGALLGVIDFDAPLIPQLISGGTLWTPCRSGSASASAQS